MMLPFLMLVCLMVVDYARIVNATVTLSTCARNGALYAADSSYASSTSYTTYQQAALADAGSLSPTPTVSSATGTDSGGNSYVAVTVSYTFTTLVTYPGIPSSVSLSRTVTMQVAPN